VFLLTALQRIFTGPLPEKWKTLPDLTLLEWATVGPLVVLVFWIGINPSLWLGYSEQMVRLVLTNYR